MGPFPAPNVGGLGPPTRKGLGPRGRKGDGSEGSGLSERRAKVVRPTLGPAIEGAHRPPAARATEAGDNGGRGGARGGQRAHREASMASAARCCFGAVLVPPGSAKLVVVAIERSRHAQEIDR